MASRDRKGEGASPIVLTLALVILAGCASVPCAREIFEASSPDLSPPQRQDLLETLEVVSLVEDYLSALEARDPERLAPLLSEGFYYGEHDRDWLLEKTARELFRPYAALRASASGLRLTVVRNEALPWLRQEAFDRLDGPWGDRTFGRPYRVSVRSPAPFSVLIPSSPPPAASPSSGERSAPARPAPVAVAVEFVEDPAVAAPMGEASFRLSLSGRREGGGEVAVEAKTVLLLQKEEGEWRIVSVE